MNNAGWRFAYPAYKINPPVPVGPVSVSATGQIPHHLAPVGPVSAAPPGKHRTIPRRPGKRSATGQSRYSGNNPTKLRFLRGSDINSSSLSTHAR